MPFLSSAYRARKPRTTDGRRILPVVWLILAAACGTEEGPISPLAGQREPSRVTATTMTVMNTNDGGPGSLRDAIANAATGDVIQFDPSIAGQTIFLTSGRLVVSGKSITINGPTTGITISGGKQMIVLKVESDAGLVLTNATIRDGEGGVEGGGGIQNYGFLTIRNSTVVDNATGPTGGGALFSVGTLVVANSTFSSNFAAFGGAMWLSDGVADLINVTVTGNGSANGGGITFWDGTLRLWNSIVAGNTAPNGANCEFAGSGTVLQAGVNLSDDNSCGASLEAAAGLGPLANNGGPTSTHNLLPTSPAIDAATNCTQQEDQRYVSRPQGSACDIGAVEFNDYVTLGLQIDGSATVNSNTGVAVVTGILTCSAPGTATVRVKLSQAQKIGKVNATVEATADVVVDCTTSHAWAAALTPATGAFKNGTATVIAQTPNTSNTTIPASSTGSLKMVWGHK
jgi:hypothetical protein